MWVGDVLRDYVAILLVDLRLRTHYLDAFSARACARLHDVHVLIVGAFTFHAELSVIVWENICLRAEIKLLRPIEHLLSPLQVPPHEILSSQLE